MKRIAIYLPSLRGGGAERVFLNLASGLSKLEYCIDLVLANATGDYLKNVPDGVNVINLKSHRVITSLPGLIKYLKKYKPISLLSALSHANVVAILAKRFSKTSTNIIISEHTNVSNAFRFKNNFKVKALRTLCSKNYEDADEIIAVSEGVAKDMIEHYGLKKKSVTVIYNPVIIDTIFQRSEEKLNDPWFQKEGPPVIVSVGRLAGQKDFETLINAMYIVNQKQDVRLAILGEGEKRTSIEKSIKEKKLCNKIKLIGFVENPYPYMLNASLFVLSSKVEGLPTVLIESLALGTPVISTDCKSGPSEILGGGKNGTLVPVGDENRMAHEILDCINNRNKYLLKVKEFQRKSHIYSLDYAIEQYIAILDAEGKNNEIKSLS